MRPCLSPLGEEISQDGLTLAFQHAAVHFRTMADMRIARNIPNRTACTELGIPGTERDGAEDVYKRQSLKVLSISVNSLQVVGGFSGSRPTLRNKMCIRDRWGRVVRKRRYRRNIRAPAA